MSAETASVVAVDGAAAPVAVSDAPKEKRPKRETVHALKFYAAMRKAATETPRPTPKKMAERLGMTEQSFTQRLYAERKKFSENADFRRDFKDQYPLDENGEIQKFEDGSYKWPDFLNLTDGRSQGNNKKPAGSSSREALRKLLAGEIENVDEV